MTINLLPWRETALIRKKRCYGLILCLTCLLISVLALAGRYYLNHLTHRYQLLNLHLTAQIQAQRPLEDQNTLVSHYQNLQQQIKLIQTIDRRHKLFWRQWNFLQTAPTEIQFNHLNWTDQDLEIQGFSSQADIIGLFIRHLENSKLFAAITINNLNQEDKTGIIHFVIRAHFSAENDS